MILGGSPGSSTVLPAPAVAARTADLARCDYDQRSIVASDAEVALEGQWTTLAAGHDHPMAHRCGLPTNQHKLAKDHDLSFPQASRAATVAPQT
jgi:hypothetical protein